MFSCSVVWTINLAYTEPYPLLVGGEYWVMTCHSSFQLRSMLCSEYKIMMAINFANEGGNAAYPVPGGCLRLPFLTCGWASASLHRNSEWLPWCCLTKVILEYWPLNEDEDDMHLVVEMMLKIALYFLRLYLSFLFFLFVSPFFYVSLSSWVISLTGFGAGITNLNEPPRAFATSTIAWIRS